MLCHLQSLFRFYLYYLFAKDLSTKEETCYDNFIWKIIFCDVLVGRSGDRMKILLIEDDVEISDMRIGNYDLDGYY